MNFKKSRTKYGSGNTSETFDPLFLYFYRYITVRVLVCKHKIRLEDFKTVFVLRGLLSRAHNKVSRMVSKVSFPFFLWRTRISP